MDVGRELEVLSREECIRLLEEDPVRVGRIAIGGPRPVIFPINYALDDGEIIFKTAEGTKFDAAVKDTFVAFEVDRVNPGWASGWSVLVRGQSHLVKDESEIDRLSNLPLQSWAAVEKPHFVRIADPLISGRRLA
jgi:uncharacterized protein